MGGREIGYLFGQYKRIRDEFAGGMIEVPMDTSIENEEDDEDEDDTEE